MNDTNIRILKIRENMRMRRIITADALKHWCLADRWKFMELDLMQFSFEKMLTMVKFDGWLFFLPVRDERLNSGSFKRSFVPWTLWSQTITTEPLWVWKSSNKIQNFKPWLKTSLLSFFLQCNSLSYFFGPWSKIFNKNLQ